MSSGKRWLRGLGVVPLLLSLVQAAFAQEGRRPTIEERLIRLEEGQRSLERRIDDLRADVNRRFDNFRFWLQLILGALVLIIGGLIAQWLLMPATPALKGGACGEQARG